MTIQEQLLKLLPEKENEYGVTIEDNMKIRGFNQAIDIMAENIKTLRVDRIAIYNLICESDLYEHAPMESYQGGVDALNLAKAICSSNILTGGEDE